MYHHVSTADGSRASLKKGEGRSLSPVSFLIALGQFRKVLPAVLSAVSSGGCGTHLETSLMGIFLYIFINY